jgi:putative ABC transport system permease protein
VKGRNFSREYATDQMSVIINESAANFLGLNDVVGTKLTTLNNVGTMEVVEIIGVFRDVHYKSLHERIEPTLIALNTDKYNSYTIVKLSGNDLQATMKDIEDVWKEFLPGQLFEYTFVDKNFETHYKTEMRAGSIFGLFSIMAIFVACLGLLGLSAFAVAKRTKEIGVRKVHGATVSIILRLLSREIIILICISSLIAWPAVYFIMNKWLNQFAYRTDINLLVFLVSTFIALVIAIIVIVYQSMKTARMNPVEALKYE